MARQVWEGVLHSYPDYAALADLLTLAAVTWPRWGISAGQLAAMDEGELAMIRLIAGE